jgi:hypothetical protein
MVGISLVGDAQQFRFLLFDARWASEEAFLNDLHAPFGGRGAPTLDLEKNCLYLFLHD